jgi:non-ribosomal peptide synthetase component F
VARTRPDIPLARAIAGQHRCGETGFTAFPADAVEQSLQARFGRAVAAHRDCLAVAGGPDRLTYGGLDELTGRIAAAVTERLGAGWAPVALVLPQGLTSVAATLGTLRAGKAYVPLDPSDPVGRLA